tara:strand:- start:83 stop:319 length:237 start_codon:yes stop_codon:yes gene_type:complete
MTLFSDVVAKDCGFSTNTFHAFCMPKISEDFAQRLYDALLIEMLGRVSLEEWETPYDRSFESCTAESGLSLSLSNAAE